MTGDGERALVAATAIFLAPVRLLRRPPPLSSEDAHARGAVARRNLRAARHDVPPTLVVAEAVPKAATQAQRERQQEHHAEEKRKQDTVSATRNLESQRSRTQRQLTGRTLRPRSCPA